MKRTFMIQGMELVLVGKRNKEKKSFHNQMK